MNHQIARMKQTIQFYSDNRQFMGSILVAQHGQILLNEGYGYANLEWQVPNTPTTKFRIASLTKQFTAVSILLLEERGMLKITDSVIKYIPECPSYWNEITIFHLLNHTSGIQNYTRFADFASFTTSAKTPEQQIAYFRDKPLEFPPGENFEYNNSAYVLLGYIIEKLTSAPYQDFVETNIFKPLDMHDSGYESNAKIIMQRASGYKECSDGINNTEYLDMSIPYSAGSLYSTTQDLLLWEKALFAQKILLPTSFNKMMTPFKNNYGFGVILQPIDGHPSVSHAGGTSGFNTFMAYFKDDALTVITLSNLCVLGHHVAQDLTLKMIALAHGNAVILPSEREEAAIPVKTLTQYVGSYDINPYMNAYGLTVIKHLLVSINDDDLLLQVDHDPQIKLLAESKTKFYGKILDIQIEFFHHPLGEISHLVLCQDGEHETGIKIHD